jgi:predicted HTH domain antitoxin
MLQIVVEVPEHYLDAMHRAPEDFAQEAKLAMAAKLYEMKRLSSGMAASLIGMNRLTFLAQLQRLGVPVIDLDDDELAQDVGHA